MSANVSTKLKTRAAQKSLPASDDQRPELAEDSFMPWPCYGFLAPVWDDFYSLGSTWVLGKFLTLDSPKALLKHFLIQSLASLTSHRTHRTWMQADSQPRGHRKGHESTPEVWLHLWSLIPALVQTDPGADTRVSRFILQEYSLGEVWNIQASILSEKDWWIILHSADPAHRAGRLSHVPLCQQHRHSLAKTPPACAQIFMFLPLFELPASLSSWTCLFRCLQIHKYLKLNYQSGISLAEVVRGHFLQNLYGYCRACLWAPVMGELCPWKWPSNDLCFLFTSFCIMGFVLFCLVLEASKKPFLTHKLEKWLARKGYGICLRVERISNPTSSEGHASELSMSLSNKCLMQ